MTIYLDEVFFWNTAADLLLFVLIQRMLGCAVCWRRTWTAALIGGGYGVAAVLPGLSWLGSPVPLLTVSFLLCAAVFRKERLLPRYWLMMLVTACAMAGAVAGMGGIGRLADRLPMFLVTFVGCWLMLSLVFLGAAEPLQGKAELLRVEVYHRDRRASFLCLRDTGNSLTDPADGRPVLVVWRQAVLPVLERLEVEELYPLCYQSVGTPCGRLVCFRAEQVRIRGELYINQPVALAQEPLSETGGWAALWNGDDKENAFTEMERETV